MKKLLLIFLLSPLFCYSQVPQTIPFHEGFEEFRGIFNSTNATTIDQLPGAYFEYTGSYGYVYGEYTSEFQDNTIEIYPEGGTARLTYTFDLTGYDVSSDDLQFDVSFIRRSNAGTNLIQIRGSETDSWLTLLDMGSDQIEYGQPTFISINSVSDTLANNGQDYSDNFSISFAVSENWINVDFFTLLIVPDVDVDVVSGIVPAISPALGTGENLSMRYWNAGNTQVSNVPVNAIVYLNGESIDTISAVSEAVLAPGDSLTHDFSETADFSATGNYEVAYSLGLLSDENIWNDTLRRLFTGKPESYSGGLPLYIDFESTGYIFSEVDIPLLENLPYATFLRGPIGWLNTFEDNDFGSYAAMIYSNMLNESTDLIFTVDMAAYQGGTDIIRLSARMSTYNQNDLEGNQIFIRGSVSDSWIPIYHWSAELGTSNTPTKVVIEDLGSLLSPEEQEFTSTFQLRFGATSYSQVLVDDIILETIPAEDVAIIGGEIPAISPALSNESVSITFVNAGTNALTEVPVGVKLTRPDGSQQYLTETISGLEFNPGDTMSHTFIGTVDLSTVGNYKMKFYNDLVSDGSIFNDSSAVYSTGKSGVYTGALPFAQDYEGGPVIYGNLGEFAVLPGHDYVSFLTEGGSIGLYQLSEFNNNWGFSTYSEWQRRSDIIWTLDLSGYDNSVNTLKVDLTLANIYTPVNEYNQVFVRGNHTSMWLPLVNWSESISQGTFQKLSINTIDQVLEAASQGYGSTFQIRIGLFSGNVSVDDIRVYAEPINQPQPTEPPAEEPSPEETPEEEDPTADDSPSEETPKDNEESVGEEPPVDDEQPVDEEEPIDEEEPVEEEVLGLSEEEVSILLYPNPSAVRKVFLQSDLFQGAEPSIQMFDQEGRALFPEMINRGNSIEIDLTGMQPAVYFIKLESKGKTYVKSLIIN